MQSTEMTRMVSPDQNRTWVRCEPLTLSLLRVLTLKFYLGENKFPPNLSSLALYPLRLLNTEFSYDEGFGSLLGSPMNGVVM